MRGKILKMATKQRKPWYHIQWFADEDTEEEKKVIIKLDLMIVPYAFLAYWAKYIDQANLSELGELHQGNFRGLFCLQ